MRTGLGPDGLHVHPARNVVDPNFTGMEQSRPDCTPEEGPLIMLGDFVGTSEQQSQQCSLFRGRVNEDEICRENVKGVQAAIQSLNAV
ncbi:hypothetical protein Vi05172_g7764 [Venturia inaequalis]|nr:hypothetical protein Vi05172_g7764 [Venturia inaequalis]